MRNSVSALKEWPKLKNIFQVFKAEHFLYKACGGRCAEDGRHKVAALCDDFIAGHRVFCGAAHRFDVLAELCSVRERDLDDSLAPRQAALEFLVGDELHFRALPENF